MLCLAAIVALLSFFVHDPGTQLGSISTICCLLYLIAPFSIVRHLVFRPEVDSETLLGAIAAYLLIGMFFAFAYKAAGEFGSVPFFGPDGHGSLSQDLFFSFVTMTTVGYGNLVPAANPGQTFAVLEAVIGQLFLVVAVGKIISNVSLKRNNRSGHSAGDAGGTADRIAGCLVVAPPGRRPGIGPARSSRRHAPSDCGRTRCALGRTRNAHLAGGPAPGDARATHHPPPMRLASLLRRRARVSSWLPGNW